MSKLKKVNRKYRLHQKLRKFKIAYSSIDKTIFYDVNKEIDNLDIQELVSNHNYIIQLQIRID